MKRIAAFLICLMIAQLFTFSSSFSQTTTPLSVSSYYGVIKLGEKFTYKIEVKLTNPSVQLEFKLLKGPLGMEVTAKDGIVTWTPTAKGEYSAEIVVNANGVKAGSSLIKLRVTDIVGTIIGTITDDNGKALANVYIILNKKITSVGKPDSYSAIAKAVTDINGKYTIPNVEAGTYYLRAESAIKISSDNGTYLTYLPIWFDDSPTFDRAKAIIIDAANPKYEANIKLHANTITPVRTYAYSFTIEKDKPFTYQISIPLPLNALPTEFKLLKPVSSLTVDKDKGIVNWTPNAAGEFAAEIAVYNNGNKIALVVIKFRVIGFLGNVAGIVKNDDSLPLKGVLVTLYKKISVAQKEGTYSTVYSAMTDEKGAYSIEKVEAGSYYVYAKTAFEKVVPPVPVSVMYSPVWYKDSPTIDKAEAIEITEANKSASANLTMHKYVKPEPIVYSISGKVTATTGALANATVLASITSKNMAELGYSAELGMANYSDPANGMFTDIIAKAVTDKDGNYKLQVRGGYTYTIACYALNYQLQYYNGKSNALEADKIKLEKDLLGIDFKLEAMPLANGLISGKIVDESGNGIVGKAILYAVNSIVPTNLLSRTVNTNDKGEFVFEKVANGKYYLHAVPAKGYIPAYYKKSDCGVRDAKLAELIIIENDGSSKGNLVCVKKITAAGGGVISGKILDSKMNGITGVVVTAESKDLNENSFAITGSDGSFEIVGLGIGDYTLISEKYGYTTVIKEGGLIDYSKNSFVSTVDIIMNSSSSVTDVYENINIPTEFNLSQNYPNPFNPETNIAYQVSLPSNVQLKVYDVLGREVAILVDEFKPSGSYNVKFDGSSLASGIYYCKMISGNYLKVIKMILLR